MEYKELLNNFDELNNKIQEAYREMRKNSEGLIGEACRQFLTENPDIKRVHWTQYTPYFNDGEACEFGVNEICFLLKDDDDEDSFYESSYVYTAEDLKKAKEAVLEAIEYNKDPEKWREEYIKKYENKYGTTYSRHYRNSLKPYPNDVAEAERNVEKIEEFLKKYSSETIEKIQKDYASLISAMNKIPEEVMKSIFGDHVSVSISLDEDGKVEIVVDEHDHD